MTKYILNIIFIGYALSVHGQLRVYGQKILDNKVKPTDDKQTLQIIDSLLCKNNADKDFYFKVFNKIQQSSDGALSEYVSTIASEYYFNYITEFIRKSNKMSSKAIFQWLDFVAFDLYADSKNDEKDLPSIKYKIDLLERKFPDTSADKIKCKEYNSYLYKKTVDLMKAE